jgi:hypothetical protein
MNPLEVTNFNRTTIQLQEFLLFAMFVAGKNAEIQGEKLGQFIYSLILFDYKPWLIDKDFDIFKALRRLTLEGIENLLHNCKSGKYSILSKGISELANSDLDLRTCTVSDLEQITGIGPKTARFFILHSRENARCAALDTHILKHLKAKGVDNVPKATPQSKKEYDRLEKAFLKIYDNCHFAPAIPLAEYDLIIWDFYANKKTA